MTNPTDSGKEGFVTLKEIEAAKAYGVMPYPHVPYEMAKKLLSEREAETLRADEAEKKVALAEGLAGYVSNADFKFGFNRKQAKYLAKKVLEAIKAIEASRLLHEKGPGNGGKTNV